MSACDELSEQPRTSPTRHANRLQGRVNAIVLALAICLSALLALNGCTAMRGPSWRLTSRRDELDIFQKYFDPRVIDKYNNKYNEADKRAFRDEVINGQVHVIDLNYADFVHSLSEDSSTVNLGTDIILLAFNSASMVATAATPKTILTSISAGIAGTKTSVDKNYFYEKTMPALISQMSAARKAVLVTIRRGLMLPTDEYSLAQALIDTDGYYEAGTLLSAIADITEASSATAAASDDELRELTARYQLDLPGRLLRRFCKPDGSRIDPANQAMLRKWMSNNGVANVSTSLFIYGDKYSDARAQAVHDLHLNE